MMQVNNFTFHPTGMDGLILIEPAVFKDERGSFMEVWHSGHFARAGITAEFVQDNESFSKQGVLRGLHFQRQHPQAKLVRVVSGEIYDVAVDLRPESATFQKWYGAVLSRENRKQLFIPAGFAHGFLVLSETALVQYKCSALYDPADEMGICWDDPKLSIQWPLQRIRELVLSPKDAAWPYL